MSQTLFLYWRLSVSWPVDGRKRAWRQRKRPYLHGTCLGCKGDQGPRLCNCEKPGTYDGVRYDDLVDFHIYRNLYKLPVLISSRSMRPFKLDLQAQFRILWIHDDVNVPFLENECPASLPIDRIFAISHWQRDVWSRHFNISAERFFLTRNGVDLKLFKPVERGFVIVWYMPAGLIAD